jgi:tetratricopeptide (TPR) repeat protein
VTPALALLFLLGADAPALPPGHPPIGDAGPMMRSAGPLPPGHPALDAGQALRPTGPLPPGHPDISRGGAGASARDIIQQLDSTPDLKTRPKPFEVAASVGKLYFGQGRYEDAEVYLRQAQEGAAALRSLYLTERRQVKGKLPDAAAAGCPPAATAAPGAVAAAAQAKADAKDHAGAAACALQALAPALEAVAFLGNARFLASDAPGALQAYAWVLEVDPLQPLALYGRAGVHFETRPDDMATLRTVKKDLTDLLQAWPNIPQAPQARALLARTEELLRAGGLAKYTAAHPKAAPPAAGTAVAAAPPAQGDTPPALNPETVEAIRNTERTPELVKGLADLVEQGEEALSKGQYQAALDAYRRVMPFEPENGRVKAGMAWALVGLNRQPMADRVWSVAVDSDPQAVDALGDLLAKKGNAKEAQALWAKLATTSPAYAQKANLQKKLH